MSSGGKNCDFAISVFYRNHESFWHKNNFDTSFTSKDMRKNLN